MTLDSFYGIGAGIIGLVVADEVVGRGYVSRAGRGAYELGARALGATAERFRTQKGLFRQLDKMSLAERLETLDEMKQELDSVKEQACFEIPLGTPKAQRLRSNYSGLITRQGSVASYVLRSSGEVVGECLREAGFEVADAPNTYFKEGDSDGDPDYSFKVEVEGSSIHYEFWKNGTNRVAGIEALKALKALAGLAEESVEPGILRARIKAREREVLILSVRANRRKFDPLF